jgi:hypothetical protein
MFVKRKITSARNTPRNLKHLSQSPQGVWRKFGFKQLRHLPPGRRPYGPEAAGTAILEVNYYFLNNVK